MNKNKNYELVIKEHHLDTFGHVNNAIYLELFEEARWEFITAKGYGLSEVVKYQKGPVILEANIKFLKELKLREKIQITFEPVSPQKSKIMQIKQRMIKDNGEISSELLVTVGFFDLIERRLISPTDEWLKVIEA